MNTQLLTDNGVDINHALELLGDMEMFNDTLKRLFRGKQNAYSKHNFKF